MRTLGNYFDSYILYNHSLRPALICPQERQDVHGGPPARNVGHATHIAWDFAELDRHVGALARGLLRMGVCPGDRVGVIMGNTSAYAILQWACARIGAILTSMNPAYKSREFVDVMRLVGVKHLFVVPRLRTSHYIRMLLEVLPALRGAHFIQEESLPELRNLVVVPKDEEDRLELQRLDIPAAVDWREIFVWSENGGEHKLVREISGILDKDDIINLQFTSGTTGAPKAVSLSHHNLLNNAIAVGNRMGYTKKDVLCNAPPLFHCFDKFLRAILISLSLSARLVMGNLTSWCHGACVVYASESFDPRAVVDAVVNHQCTALYGVPTHFLGVLEQIDERRKAGHALDFSNVRTGIAAGSTIPVQLMRNLIEKANLNGLTTAYGMTETSPVSFQTALTDSLEMRLETVGKALPHVKAKVVDPDGNIVPVNTPGEVCVSGYLCSWRCRYWNDDHQTSLCMRRDDQGTLWIHSGDEGIMDENGYLRIVGRIKDMIIRGGENLFPVQIENALTDHDDVVEAAAVAVPDDKFGEVVGVWIVRRPGSSLSRKQVRQFVSDTMNRQNAPVWVWIVGEDGDEGRLPKTASGKVVKHVLREWSRKLAQEGVGRVL
ncbi:acetyl-CoA synthetase-like protein [Fistulina hepatica ATCC 64428]|uniref:Acetyl-CoA synthetase-like protein n=1 Tax=Fistulina hepatica ATCC 64428 TaxID=1128425 RepID=A0A0D7A947_9AGAR|nr:acetyl-CoA synthetase-like protein [Fistulina hepatica ATCC 64428]